MIINKKGCVIVIYRYQLVLKQSDTQINEINQLRDRLSQSSQMNIRAELKLEEMTLQLVKIRENSDKYETLNQNLQLELNVLKSSSERLWIENSQLQKEQSNAYSQIQESKTMIDRINERGREGKLRNLERIENLGKELNICRHRTRDIEDENKGLVVRYELDMRESRSRIEHLVNFL